MGNMILNYFVLLLHLCAAVKVTVYKTPNDYNTNKPIEHVSKCSFFYGRNNYLDLFVCIMNIQPNVRTDLKNSSTSWNHSEQHNNSKLEQYEHKLRTSDQKMFTISGYTETVSSIYVKLCSELTGLCAKKMIAEGKPPSVVNSATENISNMKRHSVLTTTKPYKNKVQVRKAGKLSKGSTQNPVLLYVIPSVIVACIIILVIAIAVKKYLRRNFHQLDTTTKHVFYAELDLVRTVHQPAISNQDSPYAVVIGELRP
ncbi:uncharacterized protein LOC110384407 isoform X2 [Helicoverpa armigera]|uniref:uncharacterized protein LOC110384407 isoform X2 n=1 Tax=Helicoverpa armigera TaxID=29058 RepID=UPI00308397F1